MRLLLSLLFLPLLGIITKAAQLDTLRIYNENGGIYHYTNPAIVLQAARFDLDHSSSITSVAVTLGGAVSDGGATVHIYGNEGGLSAPLQDKDLIQPVRIRKTQIGAERIAIEFPQPLFINSSQIFIAVSDLDSGVTLLTDRVTRKPVCSSPQAGSYYYQVLKLENGEWQYGPFAYYIDVVITSDRREPLFTRDTNAIQFSGDHEISFSSTKNIACADLDGDTYIDILANGRLYFNNDGSLQERTKEINLPVVSDAHIFLDINNDGLTDILFLGSFDRPGGIAYINVGQRRFRAQHISLPDVPDISAISIADINNDGYPDLFLGQFSDTDTNRNTNKLLLNTGSFSFEDISDRITTVSARKGTCRASSFVDYNNDNFVDLYIANYHNQPDELWINDGTGRFVRNIQDANPGESNTAASSMGCHWADIDRDGDMDALLPFYAHPYSSVAKENNSTTILINEHNSEPAKKLIPSVYRDFVYEERYSGGAWGDINNDGLSDCIVTTSCPCRYADVYLQNSIHNFTLVTSELGLSGLADNNDAVWVDINNDGSLDLLFVSSDSLVVYKQKKNSGNYIQLDLQAQTGNRNAIGSAVEVYSDGNIYTHQLIAGRGRLMQDPARIHVGIGNSTIVDSVLVKWPGSPGKEKFNNITVNSIAKLTEGKGGDNSLRGNGINHVSVYPNPSNRDVNISFEVEQGGVLSIDITDVQGINIRSVYQGPVSIGPFRIQWNGATSQGQRVPSGSYYYKIYLNGQQYSGKITLID